MSNSPKTDELNLTDEEIIEVLKNHGIDRRGLMKILGLGVGVSALGGTAAGHPGRGTRIDDTFGAPYSSDDNVPSGLVDHVVTLDHLHAGDDVHTDFPSDADEGEFVFDPVGIHVKPGDIVHFDNLAHEHTASAFHDKWAPFFPRRVPDGVPGFTSPPIIGGESWLYQFTTKGVYDLFCFPHIALGMVMRVVVFDPDEDNLNDALFADYPDMPAGPGGVFVNANKVLNAPEIDDPASIVTEPDGQVAWADLTI